MGITNHKHVILYVYVSEFKGKFKGFLVEIASTLFLHRGYATLLYNPSYEKMLIHGTKEKSAIILVVLNKWCCA